MSEKKLVEVEVSKETYELMQGLVAIVKSVKEALKDGFQPGQDLPKILTESIAALPVAVAGVDQLKSEFVDDKHAFIKAVTLGADDLLSVFI